MVLLADVRTSNSALREGRPIVAVFAGATSGIGESTLKALAFNANQPRVYIIGRNEARAAALVKECHKLCPEGVFNFLKSDLSLLTNVDELCEKIKQREKGGRLDLLFMSQGYITLEGRKDTIEGIDTLMSLRYYSRMRLLYNLLPLLLQSHSPRVVSIFAPGKEGNFFPDDFSLRSHYGIFNNISHVSFMTTFFFEAIVEQNPSLSCLHVYPGLVKTAEFENGLFPNWLKFCFKWIMLPAITPFCVSVEECGERNLFHSTSTKFFSPGRSEEAAMGRKVNPADGFATGVDGKSASGVYAVNWNGETIQSCENVYNSWRAQGMTEKVWRHTMSAFEVVENGLIFAE